jgi:hypothetical protein
MSVAEPFGAILSEESGRRNRHLFTTTRFFFCGLNVTKFCQAVLDTPVYIISREKLRSTVEEPEPGGY